MSLREGERERRRGGDRGNRAGKRPEREQGGKRWSERMGGGREGG